MKKQKDGSRPLPVIPDNENDVREVVGLDKFITDGVKAILKSSGKKRLFSSGALRDCADGKPRMELIPDDLMMRVAVWYGLGAEKYGDNNWRKGQPVSACTGSLKRHLTKYLKGERDEDHLSAIVFNALSIMNVEMYHADDPQLNDLNYIDQVKGEK